MAAKSRFLRGISLTYGLLTVSLFCGCGQSKPWEKVYPVMGTVTHKGKPVKDAEIAFFPLDDKFPESVRPWAKSNENGEFEVSTYNNGDGAPAGRYKVTVIHHQIVVSKETITAKPNDLPKKYATKDSTDLTVEIAKGESSVGELQLK